MLYSHPREYDRLHTVEQQRKLAVVRTLPILWTNALVLDVGCGTGLSSQLPATIIGIDPSIEMLIHNTSLLKVCGQAEHLPFPDEVFDVVVSLTAIHNFSDVKQGLYQIARVGKRWFVFGILRKSGQHARILQLVEELFLIERQIEDKDDTILLCRKPLK